MNLKYYANRKSNEAKGAKQVNWQRRKLLQFLGKGKSVLDVGCANGSLSDLIFASKSSYFGLDYNDYFLNLCKKRKLNVQKCDVSKEKLPFRDSSFDAVWCSHILEHMSTYEQVFFFKEISRVLKKRGRLFLFAPTPYHWYFWDDETHVRPCTHGQLLNLAKNFDLKPIEAKYSLTRGLSNQLQKWLRLPPLRFILWTVYLVAEKK